MRIHSGNPVPTISVVAPCFNEASGLKEFHRRVVAACRRACGAGAYEVVLVDDGSRDGTWEVIRELAAAHPELVGVRLTRNQGHQAAASAGLALARGDRVLLIDADLQDPPELLGLMMRVMDAEEADVVLGQRIRREGETAFKRASAALFYRLLSQLASTPVPADTGDFRLMSRRVVDTLASMPEHHRFLRGMVSWVGGRQVALRYERQARHSGASGYSLVKMVRLAVDAITGFSTMPLRLATWLGFGAAFAAAVLLVLSVRAWAGGSALVGWTSIMTGVAFFSAIQLIVLGILGEYIGRLFQEAKKRPLFLVDVVEVDGRSHALPPDFAALGHVARRSLWDAIRGSAALARRSAEVGGGPETFDPVVARGPAE